MSGPAVLGAPRLHLRRTDSTNHQAVRLARAGAPHGTLVTAGEQTAGRGRQGRRWTAPPGRALLASVLVRDPPRLLPLLAAVATADVVDQVAPAGARIKWPNDVLVAGRKVAGILVEGRPQEAWAVVGIGANVALRAGDLPLELSARAASLELGSEAIEPVLERVLLALAHWLAAAPEAVLDSWRSRDALLGQDVVWAGGSGRAAGVDGDGRLVVELAAGQPLGPAAVAGRTARPDRAGRRRVALEAGEVHLAPAGSAARANPERPAL